MDENSALPNDSTGILIDEFIKIVDDDSGELVLEQREHSTDESTIGH